MAKKRRNGNTRRQYEFERGRSQDLVVAGPSDGQDRDPDMTEREAEAIRQEAHLYPRTVTASVRPTVDTKNRIRGYVVMVKRDDGRQFMVGSRQQWPDVRTSLLSGKLVAGW